MKQNKGISVISLVVTIIVLILIVSITAYEGIKTVDASRQLLATQRLQAVAKAVLAHEDTLHYAEKLDAIEGTYIQVAENDYYVMGLDDFADTENHPPIFISKSTDTTNPLKKIYKLRTPKLVRKTGIYTDDDYVVYVQEFYEEKTTQHLKVEFDEVKGVNRPLLTSDMTPIKTYFASNNDYVPTIVEDMYTEDWYNYSKEAPMWANVYIRSKTTNRNDTYVWIPRFAYRIQDIYLQKGYEMIPSSAIEIQFLRETSDYMANGDLLPAKFQVHPAFKYRDANTGEMVNLPGIWVEKRNFQYADTFNDDGDLKVVLKGDTRKYYDEDTVSMHLIKNTEWAAVAYLSMATCGQVTNGNSLNTSASGVLDMNEPCFVCASFGSVVDGWINYADRYYEDENTFLTYDSYEGYSGDGYGHSKGKKFGDAMIATSSGLNDSSAWFGGMSLRITEDEPYIMRGVDNNIFAYDRCSATNKGAKFRRVLTVLTSE